MATYKGRVLSIGTDENAGKIKVAPIEDIDAVSPFLPIPSYLQSEKIEKGDSVAYLLFQDGSGVILAKM